MNPKIIGPGQLHKVLKYLREKKKRIVTTNGCFDILHKGHVSYLQKSRRLGDVLIVALNSDDVVRKLKGKGRPLNDEMARAEVLAALKCVDFVTIFRDPNPIRFIKFVRPDIHIKATDYNISEVIEYPVVRKYGGKVILLRFVEGYSTTGTIDKMKGPDWSSPVVLS